MYSGNLYSYQKEETDHQYTLSEEKWEICDILYDIVSCLWRKDICLYVNPQLGSLNDFYEERLGTLGSEAKGLSLLLWRSIFLPVVCVYELYFLLCPVFYGKEQVISI